MTQSGMRELFSRVPRCRIALEDPCPQLQALLDLVGLSVEMQR